MNIARFEPWSVVDLLHRDLDRMAGRRLGLGDTESAVADWAPAVDIIEQQDRFLLHADVPGVSAEDIEVSMDSGVLTVAGERRTEETSEDNGYKRIERSHGRFLRRFTLPDTADADNVTASSSNGILEVSIPKQPVVQSRRITVQGS